MIKQLIIEFMVFTHNIMVDCFKGLMKLVLSLTLPFVFFYFLIKPKERANKC